MIHDPLRAEGTDDEPWLVHQPDRAEPRWLTLVRIVTVAALLVVLALVARR